MYNTILEIEANTLCEMMNASVVPAGFRYQKLLSDNVSNLLSLKGDGAAKMEKAAVDDQKAHLSDVVSKIYYVRHNTDDLAELLEKAAKLHHEERAKEYFEKLKPLMEHIRKHADALERVIPDDGWDLPKYREMLFIK
jgi:glutamine synthetase